MRSLAVYVMLLLSSCNNDGTRTLSPDLTIIDTDDERDLIYHNDQMIYEGHVLEVARENNEYVVFAVDMADRLCDANGANAYFGSTIRQIRIRDSQKPNEVALPSYKNGRIKAGLALKELQSRDPHSFQKDEAFCRTLPNNSFKPNPLRSSKTPSGFPGGSA